MRSVLTMALGLALVGTCFVATGCANRRAISRSTATPATQMRLARRANVRAMPPRQARSASTYAYQSPVAQRPFAQADAYAPVSAPTWVEVPGATARHTSSPAASADGMVYVPELGKSILDPCGIAGSEHQWVDITSRSAPTYPASGSATEGVWMPASYNIPPTAVPAPSGCCGGTCAPLTSDLFVESSCANGACDIPGACPNGQCGLPE